MRPTIASSAVIALLVAARAAHCEESADELAKKLSNPVAAMISVPFQYNADFGIGSSDGDRQTLNIQPVIPSSISENTTLITRVIAPVTYQHNIAGDSGDDFGLGDITPTFFLSPKKPGPGGLIWGAGPVFLLPTATDDNLASEKWGIGPSVVLLKQIEGGWTYGALVNHIWSVAGSSNRADISSTFLQPFLSKGLGKGRTLGVNFESTYDWERSTWNIPLNLTYTKVTKLGGQLVSYGGGVRYYFETPGDGPDWGVRLIVTLLYPK